MNGRIHRGKETKRIIYLRDDDPTNARCAYRCEVKLGPSKRPGVKLEGACEHCIFLLMEESQSEDPPPRWSIR